MNLVNLAKTGDITAISELINQALNHHNIRAKVTVDRDKLIVIVESQKELNQVAIVKYIYRGLNKLNLATYSTLVISGKIAGQNPIQWQQEVNFTSQLKSAFPSDAVTSNITNIKTQEISKKPIVPIKSNSNSAIIHVSKKPLAEIEALWQSAKYLQIISYIIIILSWLVITIQTLFTVTIIYDRLIVKSRLFYTIINITDTTGIV
ncbi:MAG: hypothetical protein F6K62_14565, partial [Sphaerospermopsis sp. SIO1G2]|nr:hypothetical protein [Sphaerospermopsis sp. SIO1G2]